MFTHQLVENIFGFMHKFKHRLAEEFAAEGINYIPSQLKVLRRIDAMAPCTSQALAKNLRRDKAQVTRLVQELINNEILHKAPNPNDKRSQLLSLTKNGRATLEKMSDLEQKVLADLSANFSGDEQEQLMSLLIQLNTSFTGGNPSHHN